MINQGISTLLKANGVMSKPNLNQHSLLILALALSACGATALAVFRLMELRRSTQVTAQMQQSETKTLSDIRNDDQLDVDEYAVRVNLSHHHLSSAQMAQLGRLQYLKTLDLSYAQLPAEGIAHLKGKALVRLDLHGSINLGEPGKALAGMRYLMQLDLSGTAITDQTVDALVNAPALIWLDLHDTGITDKATAALAEMSRLRRLCVSGAHITDDGMRSLTTAPRLDRLRLIRTGVTIKGITMLLRACPTLKVISIQQCPKIGSLEFSQLETNFPECKFANQ